MRSIAVVVVPVLAGAVVVAELDVGDLLPLCACYQWPTSPPLLEWQVSVIE